MTTGATREGYSFRNVKIKTTESWLNLQKSESGADDLWRIHDNLYDLSEWIEKHPGGKDWLLITRGMDITEAFEAHHISDKAEKMLPKFFVRKVNTSRRSLLTFSEDGFYKTLKRKVSAKLQTVPKQESVKTKFILDTLLTVTFLAAILAVYNKFAVILAGTTLTWTCVAAHNFFHQKDNWRMYTFNLSFMNYREWRISHALSHHLYPNTLIDIECAMAEPFLIWYPEEKGIKKYISVAISPFIYSGIYFSQLGLRLFSMSKQMRIATPIWEELIPLSLPFLMLLVTKESVLNVLSTWILIIIFSSFIFGVIGINAAHHHPRIYHHGDKPRDNLDFGIYQLDAVMDRTDITGSIFLVLTNFGDHGLHHLFPTIDHAYLPHLYPVLDEVCKEFKIKLRFTTQWDLIKGQFRQLLNTTPNPKSPGL